MNSNSISNFELQTSNFHRRTGKVARLPKATREKINLMILDGIPYWDIIQILGPEALGITERNLSNWKLGGYQDWLLQHQRIEDLKARQVAIIRSLVPQRSDCGHSDLRRMALFRTCQIVVSADPASLPQYLADQPQQFACFIQVLAREAIRLL